MGKKRIKKVASEVSEVKKTGRKSKKKVKKNVLFGQAYIQATYNNVIVTLTDPIGQVLTWSSSGSIGFKGAKKATPYAATLVVKDVVEKSKKMNLRSVDVFVKGIGSGRDSAIRSLSANGLEVKSITDVTPVPHNGCRPPKVRRV
jgi:small subunit ribosomal protein S11